MADDRAGAELPRPEFLGRGETQRILQRGGLFRRFGTSQREDENDDGYAEQHGGDHEQHRCQRTPFSAPRPRGSRVR